MAVDVPGISCSAGVSRESAELVLRPPGSFAPCLVSHRPLKGCARQCPGRAGKESCPFTRFKSRAPNSVTDACSGHLPTFKFFVLHIGDLVL